MEKFISGLRRILFSLPGQGLMSAVLLGSSFFAMFSTLPPLFVYTSQGRSKGVAVLSFGLMFSMIFSGTSGFTAYLVLILFTTVVLGEFVNSKVALVKTLLICTAVILVSYLLAFVLYSAVTHTSPRDVIVSYISQTINSAELIIPGAFNEMVKESGMTKAEVAVSVAKLLPSYVFITVVLFLFFNLILISRFHEHLRKFFAIANLRKFKIPDVFIWPAIVFYALFLYAGSSYNNDTFYVSAISAFLFKGIMVFYFLHGTCIAFLYLKHYIRTSFFRNLMLSLLIMFAYLFVAGLGFLDTWFDFRKFLKKGEEL